VVCSTFDVDLVVAGTCKTWMALFGDLPHTKNQQQRLQELIELLVWIRCILVPSSVVLRHS